MSLSLRIFIVYMVFVSLCSYFVLRTVMEEIRPGVKQSTEETLVDTANLLAEFLREPMLQQQLDSEAYTEIFKAYGLRQPKASIWGVEKSAVNHRIYVTDSNGIVLLDSKNIAVGQDYSRWNDVYLTLLGQYGARSSQEFEGDEGSSIMYVAAPIKSGENIIGVVSVAKPMRSLQPFIARTERRLLLLGGSLIILGLLSGALFSWWLSRELRKLREFAQTISHGERAPIPQSKIASGELRQLALALDSMRRELDGKAYVEHYVQTLAHELKSPLTGIRAAAELLQSPLLDAPEQADQRQRFIGNIAGDSLRLQQLIERLLDLAKLEQQQVLANPTTVNISALLSQLVEQQAARISLQQCLLSVDIAANLFIKGDAFLVGQALTNLLDNALDFCVPSGALRINAGLERVTAEQNAGANTEEAIVIRIYNEGEAIPDFALARLTERFFSLARPRTGKKSTGLGLNLVQEVTELHGAYFQLHNCAQGVEALMRFPLKA